MKKSELDVESMSDQELCDALSKIATSLSGHGCELLGELIARWQAAERILAHDRTSLVANVNRKVEAR